MLTTDDVRSFKDIERWYRQNHYTASLGRDSVKHFPRQIKQPDWVTIKVKNNLTTPLLQWSPVYIGGGEFETNDWGTLPSGGSQQPPTFMTHPNRLFSVEPPPSYTGITDPIPQWHAVVPERIEPGATGKAVVKGVVPGRMHDSAGSSMTASRHYVQNFVEPLTFNGTGTVPGLWQAYNAGVERTPGNMSLIQYAWDRSELDQYCWAMIDLNHSWQNWLTIPYRFYYGEAAAGKTTLGTNIETSLAYNEVGRVSGGADKSGLWFWAGPNNAQVAFRRHCGGMFYFPFQIQHPSQPGTLIPGTPLYFYPSYTITIYERMNDLSGTAQSITRQLWSQDFGAEIGTSSTSFGKKTEHFLFTFFHTVTFSTGGVPEDPDDIKLPRVLDLRGKSTVAGVTIQGMDFHSQIIGSGMPTMDWNGSRVYIPPTGGGVVPIPPPPR